MNELEVVNFWACLETLKSFFKLLEKHYPKLKPNNLEKEIADAQKALGHLEEILEPRKEICNNWYLLYACHPQTVPKSQATPELLINICNIMGKDKCHPNTAQMQTQATPGLDKSETEKH